MPSRRRPTKRRPDAIPSCSVPGLITPGRLIKPKGPQSAALFLTETAVHPNNLFLPEFFSYLVCPILPLLEFIRGHFVF